MHEHGHHEHEHEHEPCAQAGSCTQNCENCDPKAELKALISYMVKHNKSHCAELEALASQLDKLGEKVAYEQVQLAISDFEKGNMRLATVLAAMGE